MDDNKRPQDSQPQDSQLGAVGEQVELQRDDHKAKAPLHDKMRGKDAQDVAVAHTMDASDPPSFSPQRNPVVKAEYDESGEEITES